MRLLLDTHVFIRYISADGRLSKSIKDAIADPDNEVFLSVESVWEAVIKYQLRKLPLPSEPSVFFPAQRGAHRIDSLPILEDVLTTLATLPPIHRDPFDRIIVAQAVKYDMVLVSADDLLRSYPVTFFE